MKYITYIFVMVVGLLATACHDSDPTLPNNSRGEGMPTLGLSIGLSSPTRSGEGAEQWEIGNTLENYLDIDGDDYRIYFFSADNKYLATFKPFQRPTAEGNTSGNNANVTYKFLGGVPANVGINFKLLVLANWNGNYPQEVTKASATEGAYELVVGETTIDDVCRHASACFAALSTPEEGNDWLGRGRYIPFYGVRHFDLNQIESVKPYIKDGKITKDILIDLQNDNDAIPLLRAMARIEVILDNAYASFSSVRLTRSHTSGYCAPAPSESNTNWAWDYTDYFHGYNYDEDFVRDLHIPVVEAGSDAETNVANGVTFTKVSSRGIGTLEKWVAYVPEYLNVGATTPTEIEVTLANPDDIKDWGNPSKNISFVQYADGAPTTSRLNIERNNIYRFTVTGMSANLECEVEVIPYASVDLVVDYGFKYDSRGDMIVECDQYGVIESYLKDLLTPDMIANKRVPINNKRGIPVLLDEDGNVLKDAEGRDIVDPNPVYVYRLFQNDGYDNPNIVEGPEFVEEQDYYAIVKNWDYVTGEFSYEIWLKDKDECRVLTNYNDDDTEDGLDCHARTVVDYSGANPRIFHKDRKGNRRIFHYPNHASIVMVKEEVNGNYEDVQYLVTPQYSKKNPNSSLTAIEATKYKVWYWDQRDAITMPEGNTPPNPNYNHCQYIYVNESDDESERVVSEKIDKVEEDFLREKLGLDKNDLLSFKYSVMIGKTVLMHTIHERDADGELVMDNGNIKETYDFELYIEKKDENES